MQSNLRSKKHKPRDGRRHSPRKRRRTYLHLSKIFHCYHYARAEEVEDVDMGLQPHASLSLHLDSNHVGRSCDPLAKILRSDWYMAVGMLAHGARVVPHNGRTQPVHGHSQVQVSVDTHMQGRGHDVHVLRGGRGIRVWVPVTHHLEEVEVVEAGNALLRDVVAGMHQANRAWHHTPPRGCT
jgi:hypothetical protein